MLNIFVNKLIRGKETHQYNYPAKMHHQRVIWSQELVFLLVSYCPFIWKMTDLSSLK